MSRGKLSIKFEKLCRDLSSAFQDFAVVLATSLVICYDGERVPIGSWEIEIACAQFSKQKSMDLEHVNRILDALSGLRKEITPVVNTGSLSQPMCDGSDRAQLLSRMRSHSIITPSINDRKEIIPKRLHASDFEQRP